MGPVASSSIDMNNANVGTIWLRIKSVWSHCTWFCAVWLGWRSWNRVFMNLYIPQLHGHCRLPVHRHSSHASPRKWVHRPEESFDYGAATYKVVKGLSAVSEFPRICCCLVTKSCSIFVTPWTTAYQASLFPWANSQSLLKLMSTELVMPSNYLILCHPLLLLPSVFPRIRVFTNEAALHIRWSKYWNFSFSLSPFNEYPEFISFRIGWFDLFAVSGTLKSLPQHHTPKASFLQCSAFFMVQVSQLYMTTGKIIALTIWTFVGKVMSLLFNMLSRFVRATRWNYGWIFIHFWSTSYMRFMLDLVQWI